MTDGITIAITPIGGTGGLLSLIGDWLLRSHNERMKKIAQDSKANERAATAEA